MSSDNSFGQDSVAVDQRVWRLSGTTEELEMISFEFAGPHGASDTLPFKPTCVVGRDPACCDFVIDDPSVSRRHAELRYFEGRGVGVRDLRSTNRTFVNDQQVSDDYCMLDVGHRVRFGRVEVTVSYPR
jgi:hypothetical protein